jgi:glycosyltransferase involved in cell wall biosynthesis
MSSTPIVSIVIPTYNRADLLKHTIDSILAQTYQDFEIIVVDNASTDDTPALIAAYQERDARVQYIRKPVNTGLANSYNMGRRHAKGTYLAWVDSDDLMTPDRLERQVGCLISNPDLDAVFSRFIEMDYDGNLLRKSPVLPAMLTLENVVRGCAYWIGTMLVRLKSLEAVGEFNESFRIAIDIDFILRMALCGLKIATIPSLLVHQRRHIGNHTRKTALIEQDFQITYDNLFADPRLTPSLQNEHDAILADVAIWLSRGFYDGGDWADGARSMEKAWDLRVHETTREQVILAQVKSWAMDGFTSDPVRYMSGVLAHLPDSLSWMAEREAQLMALTHVYSAMRCFRVNNIDDYCQHMKLAAASNPFWHEDNDIAQALIDAAVHSVKLSPSEFIKSVMVNLPPEAQVLKSKERDLIAKVSLVGAFEAWQVGDSANVRQRTVDAIRSKPALLANRGLMSIYFHSMSAPRPGPRVAK